MCIRLTNGARAATEPGRRGVPPQTLLLAALCSQVRRLALPYEVGPGLQGSVCALPGPRNLMPSQALIWGRGPAQAQSQDRKGPGGLWEGVGAALKEGFEAESCSLSGCQLKNEITVATRGWLGSGHTSPSARPVSAGQKSWADLGAVWEQNGSDLTDVGGGQGESGSGRRRKRTTGSSGREPDRPSLFLPSSPQLGLSWIKLN